jgi:hypothetical protein
MRKKKRTLFVAECLLVGFLLVAGASIILSLSSGRKEGAVSGSGSSSGSSSSSYTKKNLDPNQNYHVVFSTSCSYSHDWQSYLFFFHAMMHNQPGDVTRIVSGCDEEQEAIMRDQHEKQFSIMNPNFLIHFTPEYGKQLGKENWQLTKYWNKPFGLKHWLESRFGYRYEGDISTPYDDDIVILVDPDMLSKFDILCRSCLVSTMVISPAFFNLTNSQALSFLVRLQCNVPLSMILMILMTSSGTAITLINIQNY